MEAIEEAQIAHPDREIVLRKFDLLTELDGEVEVIVNAANTQCVLRGGIAGAIARAAD